MADPIEDTLNGGDDEQRRRRSDKPEARILRLEHSLGEARRVIRTQAQHVHRIPVIEERLAHLVQMVQSNSASNAPLTARVTELETKLREAMAAARTARWIAGIAGTLGVGALAKLLGLFGGTI